MRVRDGIKAIFYDLDGTLRLNDPPGHQVFADHAVSLGLAISAEDRMREALWEHRYFAESEEIRADRLDFPQPEAFWLNFGRRQLLALGASPAMAAELTGQLNEHMRLHYRPSDVLVPGVQETLHSFREAGLILGVISNREEPFRDYLREIGLGEYFDYALAAGEVQAWKPDQAVFAHALRQTGLQAGETIYVGDNYFADVIGARNAGMKPVLLDIHGLFREPGCPVIRAHAELVELLGQAEDAWMEEYRK